MTPRFFFFYFSNRLPKICSTTHLFCSKRFSTLRVYYNLMPLSYANVVHCSFWLDLHGRAKWLLPTTLNLLFFFGIIVIILHLLHLHFKCHTLYPIKPRLRSTIWSKFCANEYTSIDARHWDRRGGKNHRNIWHCNDNESHLSIAPLATLSKNVTSLMMALHFSLDQFLKYNGLCIWIFIVFFLDKCCFICVTICQMHLDDLKITWIIRTLMLYPHWQIIHIWQI